MEIARDTIPLECWNGINQGTFLLKKKVLGDTVSNNILIIFISHFRYIKKKKKLKK